MPPIFAVTGPPGAGKTTLCRTLLARFDRGVHLEVDALRSWVVSGLADSLPAWTDETERQFKIAEAAACDVARRYQDAGFAVAIDHCRNLPRWNGFLGSGLAGRRVVRVLLLPPAGVNVARNLARTNKAFDPAELDELVRHMQERYRRETDAAWLMVDDAESGPEAIADRILRSLAQEG